jgi:hypothetical protein
MFSVGLGPRKKILGSGISHHTLHYPPINSRVWDLRVVAVERPGSRSLKSGIAESEEVSK